MVVIIGAGISGLSAAYYCLQRFKPRPYFKNMTISIFESRNRQGGWIESKRFSGKENYFYEMGPHSIRASGPAAANTLDLIDQIGLSKDIVPCLDTGHEKLIYSSGKLHQVPTSFSNLFKRSFLFGDKLPISVILKEIRSKPTPEISDESVYDFIKRRCGSPLADRVICPMICGIYAGDARDISMKSFNKTIFELGQEYGSIIKGQFSKVGKQRQSQKEKPETLRNDRKQWKMYSFRKGIAQLPDELANTLKKEGVEIQCDHRCEKISFSKEKVRFVVNGEEKECNSIICSLAAPDTANLIKHQHPRLAELLEGIPRVSVAVVHFTFPKDTLGLNAFGVLVDPADKVPILGVIFDHCVFPHGATVLTVMMGGKWFEQYFGENPKSETLTNVASEALERILGITEQPLGSEITVLHDCIPQYLVGHSERVKSIEDYCRAHKLPLGLCGSSYHGVGVNDAILSAKRVVDELAEQYDSEQKLHNRN